MKNPLLRVFHRQPHKPVSYPKISDTLTDRARNTKRFKFCRPNLVGHCSVEVTTPSVQSPTSSPCFKTALQQSPKDILPH